jgi:hypothetical protein
MKGQGKNIAYLDFDGVVHPQDVYLDAQNRPYLAKIGYELFMWNSILEELFEPYPDINIVLSTSWVEQKSFSYAKKKLPKSIANKVIGACWHSNIKKDYDYYQEWKQFSRYEAIKLDVLRRKPLDWFALDDNHGYSLDDPQEGWKKCDRDHLIYCHPDRGISSLPTIQKIKNYLESMDWLLKKDKNHIFLTKI